MRSLDAWRNRNLYEANDADFMIPSERKRVGNELRDTETGGQILDSPFKKQVSSFKEKLTEFPTPQEEHKNGLGELGMEKISKSTFGENPLKAGRTPTISSGMPVQEIAAPIPQTPVPGLPAAATQPAEPDPNADPNAAAPPNKLIPIPVQQLMKRLLDRVGGRNPQTIAATRDMLNQQLQGKLADKGRERWGAQTGYRNALAAKQQV
jgi:hypothetical protein